jgi:hypothetical protein
MYLNKEEFLELKDFKRKVDLMSELNLFQKAFIKDIKFFILRDGSYNFIPLVVHRYYKEILSPNEIDEQINNLIECGYLSKNINKTIFNGKWATLIELEINKI